MGRREESQRVLGARARSVLEVIHRRGEASAPEILAELPQIPSYSAVRSVLRALEAKGLVRHRAENLRYVYRATEPIGRASRSALTRVLDTYFGGTPEAAVKTLLDVSRGRDRPVDFDALQRLIDQARAEGR